MALRVPGSDAGVSHRFPMIASQLTLHTAIQHFRDHLRMARRRRTVARQWLTWANTKERRTDYGVAFGDSGCQPVPVPLYDLVPITVGANGIRITERRRPCNIDCMAAIIGFGVENWIGHLDIEIIDFLYLIQRIVCIPLARSESMRRIHCSFPYRAAIPGDQATPFQFPRRGLPDFL